MSGRECRPNPTVHRFNPHNLGGSLRVLSSMPLQGSILGVTNSSPSRGRPCSNFYRGSYSLLPLLCRHIARRLIMSLRLGSRGSPYRPHTLTRDLDPLPYWVVLGLRSHRLPESYYLFIRRPYPHPHSDPVSIVDIHSGLIIHTRVSTHPPTSSELFLMPCLSPSSCILRMRLMFDNLPIRGLLATFPTRPC